jgi:DNA-directed RNA polymerase specialized sigma24 family protein
MSAARLLAKAKTAQANLTNLETRADAAALKRNAAVLEAQEAGTTYAELESALGLSTSRVTQVLRRARKRRDNPTA